MMTDTTCESFEIAIERASYGALPDDESAELDAHLHACDRCRGYAASADRSRRGLAAIADAARSDVDWAKQESRLRDEIGRRLRRTLLLAGIAPVAVALSVWGARPGEDRVSLALLLTALVGSVVVARIWFVRARMRRLARLTAPAEFFGAYRAELARRIRSLETMRWVALSVILVFVAIAFALPDLTLEGRIAHAALASIVAVVWTHGVLVQLPQLRRQRETLAQDSSPRE